MYIVGLRYYYNLSNIKDFHTNIINDHGTDVIHVLKKPV